MLSRVAESVYWMFRYLERARSMSRFVDADFNNLLYDPENKENVWRSLVAVTGDQQEFEERWDGYNQANVVRFLTLDDRYSNSVFSCVVAARENARTIREIISTEMWEAVNSLYLLVRNTSERELEEDPSGFCRVVQDSWYTFTGLFHSTMNLGEAWHFARMGMLGERADKTTRILDVKYFVLVPRSEIGGTFDRMQWGALLKSTSAMEMYRKKYRRTEPMNVIEFLLFDPEFPRSVRLCCRHLHDSIAEVCGTGTAEGTAGRNIVPLLSDLETQTVGGVLRVGMHEYVDELQTRFNAVGRDIHEAFFDVNVQIERRELEDGHQGCA